ncbi:unnamed protein product [Acanthoscelides obtectus]|uniref:PiggyBac transposable element-derived protein domain-containing protein n=1 Tax=Acanthoscelides obtectus TaxID=200917 RepID=A0A9P0PEM3_ACAOB|nr:unnamed protein product [Acanthoscelides obtectus]CAK1628493.1 PiggyBac transposable element-derived protein 4 [Acanthoscelides obtectus]
MAVVEDSIFQMIADQTNISATQQLENHSNISASSRLHQWDPTSSAEIKRFFGLIAYMGLVKMPYIKDYWSRDPIFKTEFASIVMPRNRFEILLRMIHFANNDECREGDRLHKIQGLVDKLVQNFEALYHPGESVCVDESLIPFRGRLIMRQYMKQKRHKYGIKLFKLCTGHGYTLRLKIYAGKNLEVRKTTPTSVVMELCESVLNVGRTVYTDNWYTSIDLANKLLDKKTHLVGTLRRNKKMCRKK